MNNEPVAWMLLGLEDRKPKLINLQVIDHLEGTWIPLYTHPAKTLTDDGIADLIKETNDEIGMINIRTFDFVKVLLRKASEK